MSIVALKRKSDATVGSRISQTAFSTTGTHRNQGWIGQSNNFRSNSICSQEDSTVIKTPVLSSSGLTTSSFRLAGRPMSGCNTSTRPNPCIVIKHTDWQTQGNYVEYLRRKRIRQCPDPSLQYKLVDETSGKCCNRNIPLLPRKLGAYSGAEYSEHLSASCNSGIYFDNIPPSGSGAVCGTSVQ